MSEVLRQFAAAGKYVRLAIEPSGAVSVERVERCRITRIRHLDIPFLQGPSAVPQSHTGTHVGYRRFTAIDLNPRPRLSPRPIRVARQGTVLPQSTRWMPKESSGLDQPGLEGPDAAIPTTGALIGVPPIDPSNGALPNENTPPSLAANQ
jgi:hypothetical protein